MRYEDKTTVSPPAPDRYAAQKRWRDGAETDEDRTRLRAFWSYDVAPDRVSIPAVIGLVLVFAVVFVMAAIF